MRHNRFIFNGVSSDDFDIIVSRTPDHVTAVRRIETTSINGRDGELIIDHGTYENIDLSIELTVKTTDAKEIRRISSWLANGRTGKLILGREDDLYYNARVVNNLSFERLWKYGITRFIVQFSCEPYAYELNNEVISKTSDFNLFNHTNTIAKPLITVYGEGIGYLYINEQLVELNIDGFITLDCELEEAYKDGLNCNNLMIGEFPVLESGENSIRIEQGINKIEFISNFRWL